MEHRHNRKLHISSGILLSQQGDYFVPGSYSVVHGCSDDSLYFLEKEFSIDGSVADAVLAGAVDSAAMTDSDTTGITWYSSNTNMEG